MAFDIDKCSTLHVRRHNTGNRYTLGEVNVGKSNSKKDLRVLVSQDLRLRDQ